MKDAPQLGGPDVATLGPASDQDRPAVEALLVASGLPLDGLELAFPAGAVVARRGALLVGIAALERHGGAALLRSVAVAPVARGTGVGVALVEDRLAAARAAGVTAVYLLTTTAAPFFSRLGFASFPRGDVPPALAASPELASACPASATCMRLRL